MSCHRGTFIARDESPSPVLGLSLIGAFLSLIWGGIGFIAGALIGFPS